MTELEELKQQVTYLLHQKHTLQGQVGAMYLDVHRFLSTALHASENASNLPVVRQRINMSINRITELKNQIELS